MSEIITPIPNAMVLNRTWHDPLASVKDLISVDFSWSMMFAWYVPNNAFYNLATFATHPSSFKL